MPLNLSLLLLLFQTPPAYLPNFRNPCWFENLTASTYNPRTLKKSCVVPNLSYAKGAAYKEPLSDTQKELTNCILKNEGVCQRLRCLPYYYIAGFSKCGTTDIHQSLNHHPDIAGTVFKEPMYWNRNRYRGRSLMFW